MVLSLVVIETIDSLTISDSIPGICQILGNLFRPLGNKQSKENDSLYYVATPLQLWYKKK